MLNVFKNLFKAVTQQSWISLLSKISVHSAQEIFCKRLKNSKGFTMVETCLYIATASLLMTAASEAMLFQVESYARLAQTQTEVMDTRYAINSMTNEMLKIKTTDVVAIADDRLDFVDAGGTTTNYSTGSYNGHTALYRGDEVLLPEIESFTVKYYDSNGAETATIADIRQYEITITTEELGMEGNRNLTTRIIPREFLYANYQ